MHWGEGGKGGGTNHIVKSDANSFGTLRWEIVSFVMDGIKWESCCKTGLRYVAGDGIVSYVVG